MKHPLMPALLATTATLLIASVAGITPALAATGDVIVFGSEYEELTTYNDPEGCHKLPLTAHVLINKTDKPVQTYGDPLCLTPSHTVRPGYGAHVEAGSGSFSTD
ncbi:hypothetical protein ACGFNU_03985 [Spirillospora sp. NPDC048911]|uniref:hypothetical protein n=1 Tax=Spirillospora sp. NPDC048911 TaxID=3364527 RepID=UPI003717595C